MMRVNQHLDKRQSEAGSFHVVDEPGIHPGEFLEDAVLLRLGDADAVVRDGQLHVAVIGRDRHPDVLPVARILHGIVQ